MRRTKFHDDPKLTELINKFEDATHEGGSAFFGEDELCDLIDYYEAEYLPERALEVCQYGSLQYPFTASFHIRKAIILLDSGQNDDVLELLEKAENLSPIALEPKLLRSEALASVGRHEEAHTILHHLLQHPRSDQELSRIYYHEALISEKQNAYEQMFRTLQKALRYDPSNTEALDRMWVSVELSKKHEESIVFHNELLEEEAYSYKAWYNLGHAYSYLGKYPEAIEAFEYSFLINEDFEFGYRDCAEICFQTREYHKALQCYTDVLERFEADPDILLRIGQCYQALGQHSTARKIFSKAIALDPMADEVIFHLGQCQAQAGEWEKAIKTFKKALRIEDRREEYYAELADAYFEVDNLEKAEFHYQSAIELAPEDTEYWIRYATFLLDTERYDDALDYLDQAEDHAVGTELIFCRVAVLLAAQQRPEALFLLEEALTEDFYLYPSLFELDPDLETDPELQAIIETFRPM
jgi:tetratricopeptide (TPR) repeat protein